jgi:tRNA nucleotidyltransferase/poly(A) polymerase
MAGVEPKDIDLCTDANPDEQIEIYKSANIRYIETGLKHGTISVVLDNTTYEITSLRTDVETDGRHATVAYTRDWLIDLERRDFSINAMSLTFDGELIDPFNGLADLHQGLVAFVGDPERRIKEDYLRILRWFRFRGRFGMSMSYSSRRAIEKLMPGLNNISRERVWSEVRQIISGNNGPYIMTEMQLMGINQYINLPNDYNWFDVAEPVHAISKNPVTLLVAMYKPSVLETLTAWKASNEEMKLASWLCKAWWSNEKESELALWSPFKYMAVKGISREWALELAALRQMDGFDRAILEVCKVPIFPVNGYDLIALGMKPGPHYTEIMSDLKERWANSNYTLSKEDLLSFVDHLYKIK